MSRTKKLDDIIGYVEECQEISRQLAVNESDLPTKYYQWGIDHTCENVLRELKQLRGTL